MEKLTISSVCSFFKNAIFSPKETYFCYFLLCYPKLLCTYPAIPNKYRLYFSQGNDFNSTSVSNFLTNQFLIENLSFNNTLFLSKQEHVQSSVEQLGRKRKRKLKKNIVWFLKAGLCHSPHLETVSLWNCEPKPALFLRRSCMSERVLLHMASHQSFHYLFCF